MISKHNAPNNVDEYIAQFSDEIQERLKKIREIVKNLAPNAIEKISYQMPTYVLFGVLIHFGAFKKHIGLYPTPSGITQFDQALSSYTKAKGTVIFPNDKPIPYDLIEKIVKFRVKENLEKNKNNI